MSPDDWGLIQKVLTVLKPILITTKAAEGDSVSVAEVIPLLKRLKHEMEHLDAAGIRTFRSEVLAQIDRCVDCTLQLIVLCSLHYGYRYDKLTLNY